MRLVFVVIVSLFVLSCSDDTKAPAPDAKAKIEASVVKEAAVVKEASVVKEAAVVKDAAKVQ